MSEDAVVTIGLVGDTMLGRLVNQTIGRQGYRYPWGDMLEPLRSTDLNLINLETTLTTSTRKTPKVFNFKASPDRVQSLLEARIDVSNLANNHILDFGVEGMMETIKTLVRAGLSHVGAGPSIEEARKPLVVKRKDLTIGIIGCTDNEPGWEAAEKRPGTHYVSVDAPEQLEHQVEVLTKQVDLLILSIHWGPNMRQKPARSFIHFAQRMVDAGVDIVHGHSAHIFQGIEVYNKSLILYDTGDFVDDYYVTPSLRNDQSFFYRVQVDGDGIRSLEVIPVLISNRQVNRAKGRDFMETVDRLRRLSSAFDTKIVEKEGKIWVPLIQDD